MMQVYKGHHKTTKEVVAVKVVDAQSLSDKTKEYHDREKKILSALSHDNIVLLKDLVVSFQVEFQVEISAPRCPQ